VVVEKADLKYAACMDKQIGQVVATLADGAAVGWSGGGGKGGGGGGCGGSGGGSQDR
jgi:hypothetical protein